MYQCKNYVSKEAERDSLLFHSNKTPTLQQEDSLFYYCQLPNNIMTLIKLQILVDKYTLHLL